MFKTLVNNYHKKLVHNKYITKFGNLVYAENLWHFNRESVAKAIALGVACAWIPLPFHTMIAILLAILIDCNIPLVAVAIWFANPITIPFMYYFAYEVGASILNVHKINIHFHLSLNGILHVLHIIWQPFLLGCIICGLATGILTYLLVHLLWPNITKRLKKDW